MGPRWSECGEGCYLLSVPDGDWIQGVGYVLELEPGRWHCRTASGVGEAGDRESAMALVEQLWKEDGDSNGR